MRNYYVIGDPVLHSLSPKIFSILFGCYHMKDCSYTACPVPADGLEPFLSTLQTRHVCGFNVTMPLKTRILPYLHETDGSVVGGANTVVVKDNKLYGYSTDAPGFFMALAQDGFDISGKNIVFLGAGAVTAPLVRYAVREGAAHITILNRTVARAEAIAVFPNTEAGGLDMLPGSMDGCDLLINTTPLGMKGLNQDHEDLSFLDRLRPGARVSDLIYHPPKTKLLAEAERRGHKIQNGLPMLIWQAFYAFEKFFGTRPGREEYDAVVRGLELK